VDLGDPGRRPGFQMLPRPSASRSATAEAGASLLMNAACSRWLLAFRAARGRPCLAPAGWWMQLTGNFGCFTELLALTMKKVSTAAGGCGEDTGADEKKAARFLAAGGTTKGGLVGGS